MNVGDRVLSPFGLTGTVTGFVTDLHFPAVVVHLDGGQEGNQHPCDRTYPTSLLTVTEGKHPMTEPQPDNLPAVRDPELDRLARLGQWLALSESGATDVKAQGASAALRLYYAEQLGLPPLAVAELSVIKGRLFVSAQLLRALAEDRGYRVERVDADDQTCTAVLRKAGVELGRATFTIDDAKRAGLIRGGSAWTTHPARMLWARASKNVIMDFAPAVALGLALDDEAVEYRGETIPGEIVGEEDIPWPDPAEELVEEPAG